MNHHPGEIGFPGGATENSDLDFIDTMYRETKEEIGLNKNDITIIGKLDDVITSTQFLIKPYVGIIKKPMEYKLSSEVEKIMNVPVSDLNNPINWRYDSTGKYYVCYCGSCYRSDFYEPKYINNTDSKCCGSKLYPSKEAINGS